MADKNGKALQFKGTGDSLTGRKAPSKAKAPKKTSPEYQNLASDFKKLFYSATHHPLSATLFGRESSDGFLELPKVLAQIFEDPNAAAVADGELVLARLASVEIPGAEPLRQSQDDYTQSTQKFIEQNAEEFAQDPKAREQLLNRWQKAHDDYAAAKAAKDAAISLLIDAGCDPAKTKKGERDALESYVSTLVNSDYYPGAPYDQEHTHAILERMIAKMGEPLGGPGLVLYDATWNHRWDVFARLLDEVLSTETFMRAAGNLILPTAIAQPSENEKAARTALFVRLAKQAPEALGLAYLGRSYDGVPQVCVGALSLAISRFRFDVVNELLSTGLDINRPSALAFNCAIAISNRQLPEQIKVHVGQGLTALDLALRVTEVFDQYDAVIADRDPAHTAADRRKQRDRAQQVVDVLVQSGAKPSGHRRQLPPIQAKDSGRYGNFKPRLDSSLMALFARLGEKEDSIKRELSTLDTGLFGPMHYAKDALVKLSPLLPPSSNIDFHTCWLKALLGYNDSLAGVDPEQVQLYPEECRTLFRHGEWLGEGSSGDVAVHDEKTGKVYLLSIEHGRQELEHRFHK
jgi:hypothetical protein